jgi:hypothetical protein
MRADDFVTEKRPGPHDQRTRLGGVTLDLLLSCSFELRHFGQLDPFEPEFIDDFSISSGASEQVRTTTGIVCRRVSALM